MSVPIIMHINYFEQGQSLDETCHKAVALGFDGIEFRQKRDGIDEGFEEYLDEVAEAVDKSGLKHAIFGSPCVEIMKTDAAEREAAINEAVKFYKLASQRFKLSICNAFTGSVINPDPGISYFDCERHGSFIAGEEHWKWAVEGFKILADLAEENKFRFAFETHMGCLHDTPAAARKLAKLIDSPAVGVNLDYGNAVYFKNPPSVGESISIIGDKLYYLHLKNSIGSIDGSRVPTWPLARVK